MDAAKRVKPALQELLSQYVETRCGRRTIGCLEDGLGHGAPSRGRTGKLSVTGELDKNTVPQSSADRVHPTAQTSTTPLAKPRRRRGPSIRRMHLTGAFFANAAGESNGMLEVSGGCWSSTTVQEGSTGFRTQLVVLADVGDDSIGQEYVVCVDANGPTGSRWTPAISTSFVVSEALVFMFTPQIVLPIETAGGRHVYNVRIQGQHNQIALPLQVNVATG